MDHTGLREHGALGPSGPSHSQQQQLPVPPATPQLPPQMFTTAAQLLDLTDSTSFEEAEEKLMVSLRDGRKLIGVLRSWDQFGNLILQDTIERYFVKNLYADVERGMFLIRGENVSLLGEIDLDKDDYIPEPYQPGSIGTVFELKRQEEQEKKVADKSKQKKLANLGFEGEHLGEGVL